MSDFLVFTKLKMFHLMTLVSSFISLAFCPNKMSIFDFNKMTRLLRTLHLIQTLPMVPLLSVLTMFDCNYTNYTIAGTKWKPAFVDLGQHA